MSLLSLIFGSKPKSANMAKERLQLIIARERADDGKQTADFLPAMQQELVAVISKYVHINANDIKVSMEKKGNYEVLEVNIVMPH